MGFWTAFWLRQFEKTDQWNKKQQAKFEKEMKKMGKKIKKELSKSRK